MNKLQLDINSELHIVAEGLTDDQMITIRTLLESFAIRNRDTELLDSIQDVFDKSGKKETDYLNSVPGMTESILKGIATPIEECIPEESLAEGDNLIAPNHVGRVAIPETSVSVETPPTELMSDPMTDQLVLGKMGKKYVFNYAKIEDLFLNQNKNQSQLASMAGVNVITMRKYLDESGLLAKKKRSDPLEEPSETPKKEVTRIEKPIKHSSFYPKKRSQKPAAKQIIYKDHSQKCPVCGKIFVPAPQHIYKNKKGIKVCSYTCARKCGGM